MKYLTTAVFYLGRTKATVECWERDVPDLVLCVEARPGQELVVSFAHIENRNVTIQRITVEDGKAVRERFRP